MVPTLYYVPLSPPCQLVLLVAKRLNVELKLREMHPLKHGITPEYIKANPARTIPTLDDNGFHLAESRAIAVYLLEEYGKNDELIPKDPKNKALVLHRLFFDEGLWQRAYAIAKPVLYFNKLPTPEDYKRLEEGLGFLDAFLEGRKFLTGDKLTVADYSALTTVTFIETLDLADLNKYSNILPWLQRVKSAVEHYEEFVGSTCDVQKEQYMQKYNSIKPN